VGQGAGRVKGVGGGAAAGAPRRGSRWRQPAARAGLVWRLRAKPKAVTPGPAETWGQKIELRKFNAIRLVVENEPSLTFSHQKQRGNVQCVL
jgi:hypothetical protein